jgi:pSer/pThr/pTyr-binding forkhead associated (FHA) protein
MARLLIKSDDHQDQVIELKLGVNRLGRSPENDFQIEHSTISATHCEVMLADGEVVVRDCDSTNGTFVGGQAIQEARLSAGQTFRLGDVEVLVESTDVTIAIPKFDEPRPAPPVVLEDGSLLCPRHPAAHATHQCTHCREVLCELCVHRVRRRGGTTLKLCPLCSHPCEPIGGVKPKKKRLFGLLHKTVKLPFIHPRKEEE